VEDKARGKLRWDARRFRPEEVKRRDLGLARRRRLRHATVVEHDNERSNATLSISAPPHSSGGALEACLPRERGVDVEGKRERERR
jgi:hypothetical protein